MEHTLTIYSTKPLTVHQVDFQRNSKPFTEGVLCINLDDRKWFLWPQWGKKLISVQNVWAAITEVALEAVLEDRGTVSE